MRDLLPGESGGSLVTCIGVTSGLGRLIFGWVADQPGVNRIFLQQISFVAIGICTMLLTTAPYFGEYTLEAMMVFALIMGLFDGCFITMFGPIAFDICGPTGAAQGIGFILGLCSFPLTIGPPIAGWIYDRTGEYTASFLAAGVPPIVGALIMTCIHRVGRNAATSDDAEVPAPFEAESLLQEQPQQPKAEIEGGQMTTAVTSSTLLSSATTGERGNSPPPPSYDASETANADVGVTVNT